MARFSPQALRRHPRLRADAFREFVIDWLQRHTTVGPTEAAREFNRRRGTDMRPANAGEIFQRMTRHDEPPQRKLRRVAWGAYTLASRK